jgi:hypothetical protein
MSERNLVSRAVKPLTQRRKPPATPTLKDAIVGSRDEELSEESVAGVAAEANLANRHLAELERWDAQRKAAAAAQEKADAELYRQVMSR